MFGDQILSSWDSEMWRNTLLKQKYKQLIILLILL